jgi:negative regulator of sigma E activity
MIASRRATGTIALALAVVAVAPALVPLEAVAQPLAVSRLDDARRAAEATPFEGTLSVQWTDSNGVHATELGVRGTGGVVQFDGAQPVIATPDGRLVLQASGWSLIAPSDPATVGQVPPLSDKFDTTVMVGPDVAGRPTLLMDVRTLQGDTDERLYLDLETGLVLRREQIDDGHAVRVVEFTSIHIGPVAQEATLPIHRDDLPQRMRPSALTAPFIAPLRLAAGYVLVGVQRRSGIVQVLYSDGLHSLSVFEQGGALDVGRLPRSGEVVAVAARPGLRYGWPGGQLITWQSGHAIYTVVGDGPAADVLAAATSVPPARRLSVVQRIRYTCRRLLVELAGRG